MSDKILQIIPAPVDMRAIFKDGEAGLIRADCVACLALMEGQDGNTSVEAMVQDISGFLEPAIRFEGFTGFRYGEQED